MQTIETKSAVPQTIEQLLASARLFRPVLTQAKDLPPEPGMGWYPYETIASIDHISLAIRNAYGEFARALRLGPLLDVGCADGDLSCLFQTFGLDVTAVDHRPTNYNWMAGVRALSERLGAPIRILERDVDRDLALPGETYGLTLLLGILYHLKNPYLVLETLARQSRYCLLSTRVADVTPRKTKIADESLAYLLAPRETNADSSNYWIFSPAGLTRVVERSGWRVIGRATVGCQKKSDPVRPDRDARAFLFLQSTICSAPARVQLLDGWQPPSQHAWAWTGKRFALEVELLHDEPVRRFTLKFQVPNIIADISDVSLSCLVNGKNSATRSYKGAGEHIFEAALPRDINQSRPLQFLFVVSHKYKPQASGEEDRGVIVHRRGETYGVSEPIPFWLD